MPYTMAYELIDGNLREFGRARKPDSLANLLDKWEKEHDTGTMLLFFGKPTEDNPDGFKNYFYRGRK